MNSAKTPNTDIPCSICSGSRVNPSHGQECGACGGTGLSTAPWSQRRRATIVTLWDGCPETLPAGAISEEPGTPVSRLVGGRRQNGRIVRISWPNPDYDSQTKLARSR